MYLILNQSSSFAEALICEPKDNIDLKVIDSKHFFSANENLNIELPKWISGRTISKAFICTRHLTKIFDTRLGGSVAQIVDPGLEDWSLIRQPLQKQGFAHIPTRTEALGAESLIKAISARTLADGTVEGELTEKEMLEILEELRSRGAKRVCINLVHQKKNPVLSNQLSSFLTKHEFKVFQQQDLPGDDEVARFRHNCLSACLGGTFNEYQESLAKALSLNSDQIYFLTASGSWKTPDESILTSMLFGWSHAIKESFNETDVLYLGYEHWEFLPQRPNSPAWNSPWGPLALWHQPSVRLITQPTLELKTGTEGFVIGDDDRKFEPGPMCLGRGFRPLIADILIASDLWPSKYISESGKTRFQNQIDLCSKSSGLKPNQIVTKALEDILTRLASEVFIRSEKNQIVVTGPMAELLFKFLQKKLEPELNLIMDKDGQNRSVQAIKKLVSL